jgi:uncharacterized protein DUF6311
MRKTRLNPLIDLLVTQRPCWMLLLASFVIGCVCAASVLPIDLVTAKSHFWIYPGGLDQANVLVGYLYFVMAPWSVPLLQAPLLGPAPGTNIFWLDVVPWLALVGKAVFSLTGAVVNPYGLHLFACLSLPAVAMTALLAAAGHRTLLAALSGAVIVEATPYLLSRSGHFALLSHYLIIFGLALYLYTVRRPVTWLIQVGWGAFLVFVLLTNMYLFVMVGGLWVAALVQAWLRGGIGAGRAGAGAAVVVVGLLSIMLLTGQLTRDLAAAGTDQFGVFSMNLLSPFIPQRSGVISAFSELRVGVPGQSEGFAYLGLGVLLLLCGNLRSARFWLAERGTLHVALIVLLAGYFLFALSNKIFVGNWLILDVPLPASLLNAFGVFRASGRFFWPVGYALVALGIILTLRNLRSGRAILLLSFAALIQWIDAGPLRAEIAENAARPSPAALDRELLAARMAETSEVIIIPSFTCIVDAANQNSISVETRNTLLQQNMEVQLAAARANRRTNSVYTARELMDCAIRQARESGALRPGVLYVFLQGFGPSADQMGGAEPSSICEMVGQARFCEIAKQR